MSYLGLTACLLMALIAPYRMTSTSPIELGAADNKVHSTPQDSEMSPG
jgi:hypothetical protein